MVNPSAHAGLAPALSALGGAVSIYDRDTAEHSGHVANLCAAIARSLDLSEQEAQTAWWAAMLHDLGKLAINVGVLHQVGPLDDAQWRAVHRHPEVGSDLLLAVSPELAAVAAAVRAHHERWDGAGYPDGLRGEEIPLFGRVIAIADAFDFLTRGRQRGHEEVGPAQAIAEIQHQSGTQFDPHLVPLFVELHNDGLIPDEDGHSPRALTLGDEERAIAGSDEEHSSLDDQLQRTIRELRAAGLVPRLQRLPDVARFPKLALLTFREWEVLVLLLEGERVASIAAQLYVSPSTVRSQLSSIFAKVGAHSQADLIHELRSE